MRSRNVKPGFFKNEDLAGLPPHARLMFAGLWCLADREGRLEDRPARIKAELFPYEDIDTPWINRYLTVFQRLGIVVRYVVGSKAFIEITGWAKHQHPHHTEKQSEIPPSNHKDAKITVIAPLDNGGSPSDSLIPDSLIPDSNPSPSLRSGDALVSHIPPFPENPEKPRSVNTGNGKARKVAMPDGFVVSDRVRAWATERGLNHLDEHLEAFRAKCAARGYRYADWDAAFMEAVREDWAGLRAGRPGQGSNQAVVEEFLASKGLK